MLLLLLVVRLEAELGLVEGREVVEEL